MSFAAFPADYFNYVMLFNNSNLASKFGLTPNQTLNHLSKHQWSSLPDLTQIKKVLSKKTLKLNVYYDDLSYTSIEEQEKMNLIDMVANVGGTLGLFLGVSFLSFMVRKFFLEFLIFYLQFIITRYKIIFWKELIDLIAQILEILVESKFYKNNKIKSNNVKLFECVDARNVWQKRLITEPVEDWRLENYLNRYEDNFFYNWIPVYKKTLE